MQKENLSMAEANKLTRVLSGTPLKYTVTLHLSDGRAIEFQAPDKPELRFWDADRCLWLFSKTEEYGSEFPMMRWPEGAIITVETNPKS